MPAGVDHQEVVPARLRGAQQLRADVPSAQAHNSQLDSSGEFKWALDPPLKSGILPRFHSKIRCSALFNCEYRIYVHREEQLDF